MNETGILFILIIILFILSAFFSSSETALMAIDRYRLRHLAENNNKNAQLAQKLLEQPDRLIALILLGNNFINILITQLATYLGYKVFQDAGIAITTGLLTFLLLIFAELMPKTVAALNAEKIALPAARLYFYLLKYLHPIVWFVNSISLFLLKIFKKNIHEDNTNLNHEELRSLLSSAGKNIPKAHQEMLLSVLDLQLITVEDIMIPRYEITGIDLEDDWHDIEEQLLKSPFTRLLVYRKYLDNTTGFIQLRQLTPAFKEDKLDREHLETQIQSTYFVPEGTPLAQQLINFRRKKRRIALVVNEYGEIQGLITLEDILEEIVGELSTNPNQHSREILKKEKDRNWLDGGSHIREINKQLNIDLPINGPKTINGLILEHLESIPVPGMSVLINGYPMEIRKTHNNAVKTLIVYTKHEQKKKLD